MSDENENEYEQALDFFVTFEGVSKRSLNVIPKNTLVSIKRKIDDEYFPKDKMKEILKDFIKKEIVDEKYMKISDVEKNYTPNDQVPESEELMEEPNIIVCGSCGCDNFDFMYDHEKTKYHPFYCIYCGSDLYPPLPTEIRKKYEARPHESKSVKSYRYKPKR